MGTIGMALIQTTRALRDERGQTLVEYGLIILFIAIGAVLSVTTFGGQVEGLYQTVSAAFS